MPKRLLGLGRETQEGKDSGGPSRLGLGALLGGPSLEGPHYILQSTHSEAPVSAATVAAAVAAQEVGGPQMGAHHGVGLPAAGGSVSASQKAELKS